MEQTLAASGSYRFNRISFFLNGKDILVDLPPGISTLDFLHKIMHMYGSKCSCNEGDCGACTVVIAQARKGTIVYESINSCLYPAAKLHGKHLITIEGLGNPEDLHPIQKAILEHHGTQCGYCTPGFVMSLFALLVSTPHPDKSEILAALEGNLCRCTGYQSILDAALDLSANTERSDILPLYYREIEPKLFTFNIPAEEYDRSEASLHMIQHYHKAHSIEELCQQLARYPEARLIAGGTDIMVQVNIARRSFERLIDLTDILDLSEIQKEQDGIHIGCGVTYSQIMDSDIIKRDLPYLVELCSLIASKQIRNFGTLAGNVANASPVGDSLPLLLVLQARLALMSQERSRELPVSEFFVAYRKTALQKGEFIREIIIPVPPQDAYIDTMKSAKRKSVDISSVVSAICIPKDGTALLAFGGVAATPALSKIFSKLYQAGASTEIIAERVAEEFSPLSDVRGSSSYRKQMIINHIIKYLEGHDDKASLAY
nr:xanthine dehydrogenase small subunit [Candidatus Cloacimonadota bacterium]